jgi:formylglycine-generating enzyme required for sulfatase activity
VPPNTHGEYDMLGNVWELTWALVDAATGPPGLDVLGEDRKA